MSDMSKLHFEKVASTISWTSALLVLLLAVVSFSLSFEALRMLVIEKGVVQKHLAWVFPLGVDGSIVVFSLCALRSSLRQESAVMQRLLVVAVTILSVFLNIAHVDGSQLAMLLAGTPPVLLFLSFEALMHTIQKEAIRERDKPEPIVEEKQLSIKERKAVVAQYLEDGLTATEIADQMTQVSLRTIQRDIAVVQREKEHDNSWPQSRS